MDMQQQQLMARALLDGGMPAWRVEHTVAELVDHYWDIQEEALTAGCNDAEAALEASRRVGELTVLADCYLSNNELCDWPLLAGIENHAYAAETALVKRWILAVCCSALGTGALLLSLHLAIATS